MIIIGMVIAKELNGDAICSPNRSALINGRMIQVPIILNGLNILMINITMQAEITKEDPKGSHNPYPIGII